jgi:DNA-binding MarR family transcriptional regulator/N-acetylglutamate synthase-like GNAT family acetyltransferase
MDTTPIPSPDPERVAALRAFSRFYTRRLGVLDEHLHATRFSLPAARVLWELAHGGPRAAGALARELGVDAGYLSRLVRGLHEQGLLRVERPAADGRQRLLSLTAAGRRAFAPLDRRAQVQAAAMLAPLTDEQQRELVYAAARMQALLLASDAPTEVPRAELRLRPHRAGDIGWIVSRHGALYAAEYGWDLRFEALVARIGADFVDHHDATREACWIAERHGTPVGCVCLVQARDEASGRPEPGVAQLRLLLVEPAARGLGAGHRLVDACTAFARDAGYRRIRLWTNSVLLAARRLYVQAGYRLLASEPHHSFGQALVGETWELEL